MTIENMVRFLPLTIAYSEGKIIQCKHGGIKWHDIMDGNFEFTEPPSHYRIKPEPREFDLYPHPVEPECWIVFPNGQTPFIATDVSPIKAKEIIE